MALRADCDIVFLRCYLNLFKNDTLYYSTALSLKVIFARVPDVSCMQSGCSERVPRMVKKGVAVMFILLQLYR